MNHTFYNLGDISNLLKKGLLFISPLLRDVQLMEIVLFFHHDENISNLSIVQFFLLLGMFTVSPLGSFLQKSSLYKWYTIGRNEAFLLNEGGKKSHRLREEQTYYKHGRTGQEGKAYCRAADTKARSLGVRECLWNFCWFCGW